MPTKKLVKSKNEKNDEFYTQYSEIQREINAYLEYNPNVFKDKVILLPCDDPEWSNFTKFFAQNFERFGLRKMISTSYSIDNKTKKYNVCYQLSLFETESPIFDEEKSKKNGKIFILDKDKNKSRKIDIDDLEWDYLDGDGDFRSAEVKKLRDEADIIITNPPFSLFRQFVDWIMEAQKKFIIMGNKNAISYKEIFPYLMNNKMWVGASPLNGGRWMIMPDGINVESKSAKKNEYGQTLVNIAGVCWFTNVEHGKRHQALQLMTMDDNIKYSRHNEIKTHGYLKYDNYNAIDIPYVDSIPIDYRGIMGVPITFMDKYNPDQFRILALGNSRENFTPNKDYKNPKKILKNGSIVNGGAINCVLAINVKEKPNDIYYVSDNSDYLIAPYARILIEFKEENNENIIKN